MATIEGAKRKYEAAMRIAYERDNYTKGMADFFGVSPSEIAGADPVKAWKDKFDTDADRRERADNWEAKLKAAFGLS